MDPLQRQLCRTTVIAKLIASDGDAFQKMAEACFQATFPDFECIAPHGNRGDGGNDGWISSEGIYIQIYGPLDPSKKTTIDYAAKKAAEDLEKLLNEWDKVEKVEEYWFVFNDHQKGTPAPLAMKLHEMQSDSGIVCKFVGVNALTRMVLELDLDAASDIVDFPIGYADRLSPVSFDPLRQIIGHLCNLPTMPSNVATLNAPNFDQKLIFNGLPGNQWPGTLLVTGGFQVGDIEQYFESEDPFLRQEVRDRLAAIYADSKKDIAAAKGPQTSQPSRVFLKMVEGCVPPSLRKDPMRAKAAENAAIVLISFYFQSCDVFEDPDAST